MKSGQIIAELIFCFWTSLFDAKYEMNLWKNLRFSFPYCSKQLRQRKTISRKLNRIRKLRNRIFHHESISWNIKVLENYKTEMIEIISWFDKELLSWLDDLFRIEDVLKNQKITQR